MFFKQQQYLFQDILGGCLQENKPKWFDSLHFKAKQLIILIQPFLTLTSGHLDLDLDIDNFLNLTWGFREPFNLLIHARY